MNTRQLLDRYAQRSMDTLKPNYIEEVRKVDLDTSAFLMVDVMGALSPIMKDYLVPALASARRAGLPIIYAANAAPHIALDKYEFTKQRYRSNRDNFSVLAAAPHVDPLEYHKGDGPWAIYADEIRPQAGDYLVKKVPYSGFHETRLDTLLRNLGVCTIVSSGFAAHMCLRGTLIDGLFRNYRIILLRDCTSGGDLLPEERQSKRFTSYMVQWMETYVCESTTSEYFQHAFDGC